MSNKGGVGKVRCSMGEVIEDPTPKRKAYHAPQMWPQQKIRMSNT